jgi:hypothetical protein
MSTHVIPFLLKRKGLMRLEGKLKNSRCYSARFILFLGIYSIQIVNKSRQMKKSRSRERERSELGLCARFRIDLILFLNRSEKYFLKNFRYSTGKFQDQPDIFSVSIQEMVQSRTRETFPPKKVPEKCLKVACNSFLLVVKFVQEYSRIMFFPAKPS